MRVPGKGGCFGWSQENAVQLALTLLCGLGQALMPCQVKAPLFCKRETALVIVPDGTGGAGQ